MSTFYKYEEATERETKWNGLILTIYDDLKGTTRVKNIVRLSEGHEPTRVNIYLKNRKYGCMDIVYDPALSTLKINLKNGKYVLI